MPEYSYICNKEHRQWDKPIGCGHRFSIITTVRNYTASPICPSCNQNDAIIRDYREDNVNISIALSNDKLTVGHLAKRNTDKLSNDEKVALYNKHNDYRFQKSKVKLGKNMKSYGKLGERVDKLPTGNMKKKRPINKKKERK